MKFHCIICIGRASLKKSKILLLNEATSSIDKYTDELIQKLIRQQFKNQNVLCIAHRLQTIVDYDKIMVLDNGEIIEFDTAKNLDVFTPTIYIQKESVIEGGSASGKRYTHCVVDIPVARKYKFYIFNTFMALLVIEIFAFSIYFCAPRPLAKGLAVIATLLLTLFTFKITVSESMPPTPYVTLLDCFFHKAKLLLVLHVLAQILVVLFESEITYIKFIYYKYNIMHTLTAISKTARMSLKQSINTSMSGMNDDLINVHDY